MQPHDEPEPSGEFDPDDELILPPDPFDLAGHDHVGQALRWHRSVTRRIARIDEQRAAHIANATREAEAFRTAEHERLTGEAARLAEMLADWAVARRLETNTKTFHFPAGTITTREADQWSWPSDADSLVDVVVSAGRADLVTTTTTLRVDKAALKKAVVVKDDVVVLNGEVLPGVTVETVIAGEVKCS